MKQDCKVPENRIYCVHCKSRKHNTYPGCPAALEKEKGEKKGNGTKGGDKRKPKGNGRGGPKLRSPPPDKARRAEGEEADLEDYDESDDGESEEGGYSGSASHMQLVVGSIARLRAQLGDNPPEGKDTETPPDTSSDEESSDEEPLEMPPLVTDDERCLSHQGGAS